MIIVICNPQKTRYLATRVKYGQGFLTIHCIFDFFLFMQGGGIPPVLKAYSELGDHSRRCSVDHVGDGLNLGLPYAKQGPFLPYLTGPCIFNF